MNQSCKNAYFQRMQGFTFIEVLAGILISTIFVLISAQAIVLSTVFRVKARQLSEATNWVREDLEEIRFQATNNLIQQAGESLEVVCENTEENPGLGFAAKFADILFPGSWDTTVSAYISEEPRTLLNASFTMQRVLDVYDSGNNLIYNESYSRSIGPYNTLKIYYEVFPATEDMANSIFSLRAEVTPEEAYNCNL